jgi:multidrug efflux pump subunit AcrA (membrane-fusion protein)
VAGVIAEILVREGEPVRKGQLLVRFDLREARSKLTVAEAVRSQLVSENKIFAAALGDRPATTLTRNQKLELLNQIADLKSREQAARQELLQSQQRLVGLEQSWRSSNDIANRYQALSRKGAVSAVQELQTRDTANQLLSRLLEEAGQRSRTSNSAWSRRWSKAEANVKFVPNGLLLCLRSGRWAGARL